MRERLRTPVAVGPGRTVTCVAPETTLDEHRRPRLGRENNRDALANVENLLADASTGVEDVVLVANGQGVELLSASTSEHPRVASLVWDGVSFRACRNSMESRDVTESDLVEGVVELTALQAREGYANIKTP